MNEIVRVQQFGLQAYSPVWQQLKAFTYNRTPDTMDEIWLLEHEPVYTQGQAGKAEHLINPGAIPVVQSDRGGQVTYHGPGQLVIYLLTDIQRKQLNVRKFVTCIEQSIVSLLATYNIQAHTKTHAPGVYVDNSKIASIGLRVRHGRTYHGLSLNVAMDLDPYTRINPCGFSNMQMTQLSDLGGPSSITEVGEQLLSILTNKIGYKEITYG